MSDEPSRRTSAIAGHGLFAARPYGPGDEVVVLDHDVSQPADLGALNHSCDPNLGWTDARTLVARRDIAVDEELTLDYATALADPSLVLYCHCETYRCRQVVEGRDWQIPQLQQRYACGWAPAVRKLIDG